VIRKDLGPELIATISRQLKESIAYGLAHRDAALDHAMQYARGLARPKANTFVGMYVNASTLDYGERGPHGSSRVDWPRRVERADPGPG